MDVFLVVSKGPHLKTEKYGSMIHPMSRFPKRWLYNAILEVSMSISLSKSRSLLMEG